MFYIKKMKDYLLQVNKMLPLYEKLIIIYFAQ